MYFSSKRIQVFSRIMVLLILLAGCSGKHTKVVIFHTNDSHAQLDNYPRIAHLLEEERAKNPFVFLVSAGDIFSGNPMVDFYDPPGYPVIDLMNRTGYNVNTIGNHEFDYGVDILKDRMEQAGFPFILANIDVGETGFPQPDPYFILKAGKNKIAFVGIVQLNNMGIPSTHPDRVKGMTFTNPVEKLADFSFLKDKANAVIALSHHGFLQDTIMAYKYPWLDMIIGGHSHTLVLNPVSYNNVLVAHAGDNLKHLGKVTLVFKGKELIEKHAEIISLQEVSGQNDEIAALVEYYQDNPALNRIITTLNYPLEGKANLACMTSDAYREFAGLDLAFQNFGGIRLDRLEGEIRLKDIYRMDPFKNELVQQKLSYEEIKNLISNNLTSTGLSPIQISGGKMIMHLTDQNIIKELKIMDLSGVELKHDRKYKVGMPSYIASAFKYEAEDPGLSLGITTAEVVIDYLSKIKNMDYSAEERIIVLRN